MEHSQNPEIIFVVFYGLSNLGKTTLLTLIEKEAPVDIISHIVSADLCLENVIRKWISINPEKHKVEDGYSKCKKTANELFDATLKKTILRATSGRHLIILDKVINPKYVKSMSNEYNIPKSTKTRYIAICPLCSENKGRFYFTNTKFIPFSVGLILNICHRMITRENHPTMKIKDSSERLSAVLSFPLLYTGVKDIKSEFSKHANFDKFIEVPFHRPLDEDNIPPEIVEALKSALRNPGIEELGSLSLLLEDEEEQKLYLPLLGYGDSEQQSLAVRQIFNL